ncbi:hypothetical protein RUM44_003618 [Polyplax serrata]|uniref:Uncharacterized protein n=1 Tax=Polyplax serrata TaxID=468196 RepID=A0ABR1AGZ4_POLSC
MTEEQEKNNDVDDDDGDDSDGDGWLRFDGLGCDDSISGVTNSNGMATGDAITFPRNLTIGLKNAAVDELIKGSWSFLGKASGLEGVRMSDANDDNVTLWITVRSPSMSDGHGQCKKFNAKRKGINVHEFASDGGWEINGL